MSLKRICDRCNEVISSSELFCKLIVRAIQTQDEAILDLCESCASNVINSTKKYSYEKSDFFPDSFGKPDKPLSPPSPSSDVAGVGVLAMDSEVSTAPPTVPSPTLVPAPDETSLPESGSTNT